MIMDDSSGFDSLVQNSMAPSNGTAAEQIARPYEVRLPRKILAFTFLAICTTEYGVGRLCRSLLQRRLDPTFLQDSHWPDILIHNGVTRTIYSSKLFDAGQPGHTLFAKRTKKGETGETRNDEATTTLQPAGEHLLVDIDLLDSNFLGSPLMVSNAVIEILGCKSFTLLSYHCHNLRQGYACVGIMADLGHISLRTWPKYGVLSLDMFSSKEEDLFELIPIIEAIFAKYQINSPSKSAQLHWASKQRGFRHLQEDRNFAEVDVELMLLGSMNFEMKRNVAVVETQYQRVEIFDVVDERFRRSPAHYLIRDENSSYCIKHLELLRPDRILYLDGVMQSRVYGEAAYHEALVHPSMFAHENPKRVAIIGGGEGATLREVLKHKTVERVTMLEIDEEMVNLSRTFLPEWSDCSNIQGSAKSCFEDPRADVVYTDAIAWFIERFGGGKQIAEEDKYDVIIMDALDPSSIVDFSDELYGNKAFVDALHKGLSSEGIFVAQVGESGGYAEPPAEFRVAGASRLKFESLLTSEGFERLKFYDEIHGNLLAPWSFISVWKDTLTSERWFASAAQVDLVIRHRARPTRDGRNPLRFFDGATMMTYQYASRVEEELFCRRSPTPPLCHAGHGLDPDVSNAPACTFEIKMSAMPNAGRGVYFRESVPANTYIAAEESVHDLVVYPQQIRLIKTVAGASNDKELFKPLEFYLFGYGFASDYYGDASYSVDMSIFTFINHGCNGEFVMGEKYSVTEMTADPKKPPHEFENESFESEVYNPFVDRNVYMFLNGADTTLRDVTAGEELVDNYLRYLHENNWEWGIKSYRRQCSGQDGVISDYEGSEEPEKPVL